MTIFKPYKKGQATYTLGAFPTMELLQTRPEWVQGVLMHPQYREGERVRKICRRHGIMIESGERILRRLGKENTLLAGFFIPKVDSVTNSDHVALYEPRDMGNLGTIMRTMVGLGIRNLVLLGKTADPFHPKTIRAGMGAFFQIRLSRYETFSDYRKDFPNRKIFPFILDPKAVSPREIVERKTYTLLFGNEAQGLPAKAHEWGTPLMIPQSLNVDSLNLTAAVAIGIYEASYWRQR